MCKIMIVKTWSENTREGINYLKYNNYGKFIRRIPFTDLYVCIGFSKFVELRDVEIVR